MQLFHGSSEYMFDGIFTTKIHKIQKLMISYFFATFFCLNFFVLEIQIVGAPVMDSHTLHLIRNKDHTKEDIVYRRYRQSSSSVIVVII